MNILITLLNFIFAIFLGYIIGSFNPAYFLGKAKGFDIREKGSQNAGATNVFINVGIVSAVAVMLIDIFKMVFVLYTVDHYFITVPGLLTISSVSALIGHCYPFYLDFEGGKGMASYFGIIVYALPPIALAISFFFYWFSSGIMYFILKKRRYVMALAPIIGILYFLIFASRTEYKVMGTVAGVILSLINIQKGSLKEPDEIFNDKAE